VPAGKDLPPPGESAAHAARSQTPQEGALAPHEAEVAAWRERMMMEYAPLVKHVAGRIAMFLPPHIQMDDLVGDGVIGLLDAIEKFDRGRKVQFKTYATMRIRGAIVDGLRHLDWVPRRVRRQARHVEHTINDLSQQFGRTPTRNEVAAHLGIKLSELDDLMAQMSGSHVTSLDELRRMTNNAETLLGESIADVDQDVTMEVERRERATILQDALENYLSERERLVLNLYHYEGLTCKEIAQVLGVSEPRVSQLHGRGLAKLRSRLAEHRDNLVN